MIAAMNALGYDAATLGNHEFNYGLDFLHHSIGGARFPFVCANAVLQKGRTPQGDVPLLPPFVLLDRQVTDGAGQSHPLRLAVIGLLPPQITVWDANHLRDRIKTRDIVQTARHHIPLMRQAGADLVIALCHSGIGTGRHKPGAENAAAALARLPGIDALILGHSHLVFPSPEFAALPQADVLRGLLCGKPAVMPGRFGSHLGVVDLMLDRTPSGWSVCHARAQAIRVPPGESAASPAGILRISAPLSYGINRLSRWLPQFMAEHPRLRLDLDLTDRHVDLATDGIDVAVRIATRPARTNVIARRIAPVRRVLCAAPDYLTRKGMPATPADLAGHDTLSYSYSAMGDQWSFRNALGAIAEIRLRPQVLCSNGDMLCELASRGAGIINEPDFMVASHIETGCLTPILTDWHSESFNVYALYLSRKFLSAKVRVFIDYLQKMESATGPA